jgi:hypothetical protein
MKIRGLLFLSLALVGASANAQFTSSLTTIHSKVLGFSSWIGTITQFQGSIQNNGTEDRYINSIEFTASEGDWTDLVVKPSQTLAEKFGNAFTPSETLWGGFLTGLIDIDWSMATLAAGMRKGTVVFKGGADATANDTLFSHDLSFDVLDSFNFTHKLSQSAYTTVQGGSSEIKATVTAGDRDLWAWMYATQYGPSLLNSESQFVSWPAIDGGLIDGILPAGQSWNGTMFKWFAQKDGNLATPGTFDGGLGILGGAYPGDMNFFNAERYTWTVTPVPEPATMTILGLGLLAAARRRRK